MVVVFSPPFLLRVVNTAVAAELLWTNSHPWYQKASLGAHVVLGARRRGAASF